MKTMGVIVGVGIGFLLLVALLTWGSRPPKGHVFRPGEPGVISDTTDGGVP